MAARPVLSDAEAASVRQELEKRWNGLEDAEEEGQENVEADKEQWFLDTLRFLASAPAGQHCWCHFSDLSSLVLESFYHYYVNPIEDLVRVWQRWCWELSRCDSCVHVYQRSKEELREEFDGGPATEELLSVLERLDQERIAQQLKDVKALFEADNYDPEHSAAQIFPTIYEVLNYPAVLEDAEVDQLIAPVLSLLDQVHAISIGEYRPAGVYSLLFHNSPEARAVATRLAKTAEPFRNGQEMDLVQPLLRRKMALLQQLAGSEAIQVEDGEQLPEVNVAIFGGRSLRPGRIQEHLPLWLGLSSFMELLEPSAMLEGLVEQHPNVVSIVLNQASEPANPAFNVALKCLRLLFQGVGYRLWWDTDFTPKVVRSTLISHCSISQKESLHLTIFQLLEPFLQSLEMDRNTSDEYEIERESVIKYLTRDVTNRDTFSGVAKGRALEVAFRIVQRTYCLAPLLPATDLSPFWGPPLVSTLRNASASEKLRAQALELMSTVLVFDSSALAAAFFLPLSGGSRSAAKGAPPIRAQEALEVVGHQSPELGWSAEWAALETSAVSFCKEHCHVPALWQDFFLQQAPLTFPGLLTKAVLWAASRVTLLEEAAGLEPNQSASGTETKEWRYVATENGKKVANVVEPEDKAGRKDVVLLYRRCLLSYLESLRQRSTSGDAAVLQALEWETWVAKSLTTLLLDPSALVRNADREILRYFTADATLDGGLGTLCTDPPAARAVSEGIFGASQRLLDLGFPKCARGAQLLCFYATKLLHLNSPSEQQTTEDAKESDHRAIVCARIAEGMWPLLLRVLEGSRSAANDFEKVDTSCQALLRLSDYLISASLFQRLIVHVLEAFVAVWPYIRQHALPANRHTVTAAGSTVTLTPRGSVFDLVDADRFEEAEPKSTEWLVEFVRWGHVSRPAIRRRWMESIELVGCEIVDAGVRLPVGARLTIRELLAADSSLSDEQRLVLSQFFPAEAPGNLGQRTLDSLPVQQHSVNPPKPAVFPSQQSAKLSPAAAPKSSFEAGFFQAPFETPPKPPATVIEIDDDDQPLTVWKDAKKGSSSHQPIDLEAKDFTRTAAQTQFKEPSTSGRDAAISDTSKMEASLKAFGNRASFRTSPWNQPKSQARFGFHTPPSKAAPSSSDKTSPMYSKRAQPRNAQQAKIDALLNKKKEEAELEAAWGIADNLGGFREPTRRESKPQNSEAIQRGEKAVPASVAVAQEPLPEPEKSLKRAGLVESDPPVKRTAPKMPRVPPSVPRKTIRLELAGEGQTASARARLRRFGTHGPPAPPPKPDDWYRKILVMDFFKVVGADNRDEGLLRPSTDGTDRLEQVPNAFESAAQYARIFRPLLMEEFKAQLQRVHDEAGSSASSDMLEVGHFKLLSLARRDDFWDANLVAEENSERNARDCNEQDLLLLTKQAPSKGDPSKVHVLAKVERRDQRDTKSQKRHCTVLVLKLYLPINDPRLLKVKQLLTDGSKWFATKLFSMVPQLREFQAMSAFETLPLKSTLLNPASASHPKTPASTSLSKLPEPLLKQIESRYNDSQQAAIASAVVDFNARGGSKSQHLTLIQGPPGTGKTSTIMGIISALLGSKSAGEPKEATPRVTNVVKPPVKLTERKESAMLTKQAQLAWQQAEQAKELMVNEEKNGEELSGGVQIAGEGAPRILLCAQSNAAVDELVARLLKNGVVGSDGMPFRPSIVRVGNLRTIHPDSKPIHIDTLVEAEIRSLASSDSVNGPKSEEQKRQLRNSLVKISNDMSAAQKKGKGGEESSETGGGGALKKVFDELYQKRREVQSQIIALESADRKTKEQARSRRLAIRRKILREASIVVTTLSGCGGDVYSACKESKGAEAGGLFDAVIIDEAAQALEPATLIPLQLLTPTGGKCVMIGDPKQLPATVLSRAAANFNYERSLFERLQLGGFPVTMLSTQYRMHPEIRQFPSAHFYNGLLTDGDGVSRATRGAAFHERPVFGPYVFFDIVDGKEQSRANASSLANNDEVSAVLELYQGLTRAYPGETLKGRVGIITPYKRQLEALRKKFRETYGERIFQDVEFNTVDGFQGREVDVLILSTVRSVNRSNPSGTSIGFVADVRRMNVALTRARKSLWIVGNSAALKRNSHWADLVSDATQRGVLHEAKRPYSELFKPGTKGMKKVAGLQFEKSFDMKSPAEEEKKGVKRQPDLIPLGRDKKPKVTHLSPLKRKPAEGSLDVPAVKAPRLDVDNFPIGGERPLEKLYAEAVELVMNPNMVPQTAAPKKGILKKAQEKLEAAGGHVPVPSGPPLTVAFDSQPNRTAEQSSFLSSSAAKKESVFSRRLDIPSRPSPLVIPTAQQSAFLETPNNQTIASSSKSTNSGLSPVSPINPASLQRAESSEAPELPPGFETFSPAKVSEKLPAGNALDRVDVGKKDTEGRHSYANRSSPLKESSSDQRIQELQDKFSFERKSISPSRGGQGTVIGKGIGSSDKIDRSFDSEKEQKRKRIEEDKERRNREKYAPWKGDKSTRKEERTGSFSKDESLGKKEERDQREEKARQASLELLIAEGRRDRTLEAERKKGERPRNDSRERYERRGRENVKSPTERDRPESRTPRKGRLEESPRERGREAKSRGPNKEAGYKDRGRNNEPRSGSNHKGSERQGSRQGFERERSKSKEVERPPRVCRFYPNCKSGSKCKFLHVPSKPCKFFLEGFCRDGDACAYLHSDPKQNFGSGRERSPEMARSSGSKQAVGSEQEKLAKVDRAEKLKAPAPEKPNRIEGDDVKSRDADVSKKRPSEAVSEEATRGPASGLNKKAEPSQALSERKKQREEAAAFMPGAFRSQSARLAPASVQTAFAMPRSNSDAGRRKTLPLWDTVRRHNVTRGEASLATMTRGEAPLDTVTRGKAPLDTVTSGEASLATEQAEEGELVEEDEPLRIVRKPLPVVHETKSPRLHETKSPGVQAASVMPETTTSTVGRPPQSGYGSGWGQSPRSSEYHKEDDVLRSRRSANVERLDGWGAFGSDEASPRTMERERQRHALSLEEFRRQVSEGERRTTLQWQERDSVLRDERVMLPVGEAIIVRTPIDTLFRDVRDSATNGDGIDTLRRDPRPTLQQNERDLLGRHPNKPLDLRELLRQRHSQEQMESPRVPVRERLSRGPSREGANQGPL